MGGDMETVICDASSLIALSDTCHLNVLKLFKRKVNFVIPRMVEYESVTRPMGIRQYSLHAYRLKRLIDQGVIQVINESNTQLKEIEIHIYKLKYKYL